MTADLITRLRAALDEDERTARAAFGKWGGVEGTGWIIEVGLPLSEWQPPGYGNNLGSIRLEEHRKHIIRHDPLAVLADIAAKRAILDLHVLAEQNDGDGFTTMRCMVCDPEDSEPFYPCATLRLLAEAYGIA